MKLVKSPLYSTNTVSFLIQNKYWINADHFINGFETEILHVKKDSGMQGCNARKVISEVYTSLVLQCTVSGRMSKPDMGSIIHIKNQWNILVIGNYYVNYQNCQI